MSYELRTKKKESGITKQEPRLAVL